MIRIAVVEDNEQDLRQIVDKLLEYQKEHGSPLEISTFSNGMELMTHYKPIYDLLILDIEMPLMMGYLWQIGCGKSIKWFRFCS